MTTPITIPLPILDTPPQLVDDFSTTAALAVADADMPSPIVERSATTTGEFIISGTDSIRIRGSASASGQYVRAEIADAGWDLSGPATNLLFRFGFPGADTRDLQQPTNIRINLSNDPGPGLPTNYRHAGQLYNSTAKKPHECVILSKSDFTNGVGPVIDWDQPIRYVSFEFRSNTNPLATQEMYVDSVWTGWRWRDGKIPVMFTNDDGSKNAYDEWWPRLRDRGMGGTFNIASALIGATGGANPRMTWDEVRQAWQEGAEIANHAQVNVQFPTQTLAQQRDAILGCVEDIRVEGISSYEDKVLCFVGGASDNNTNTVMEEAGFLQGRTANPGHVTKTQRHDTIGLFRPEGENPFHSVAINTQVTDPESDTAAKILADIDVCIERQAPVQILGHLYKETPVTSTEFDVNELVLLLDGLAARDCYVVGVGIMVAGPVRGPFRQIRSVGNDPLREQGRIDKL